MSGSAYGADDDLAEIRSALSLHISELARYLLGDPGASTRSEWRYGNKGGLSIVVAGPKRGTWYDHSEDAGGGPFDLIMRARGDSFREAVVFAREFLAMPRREPTRLPRTIRAPSKAGTAEYAARLWSEAIPLEGTLAARYLREHRGIPDLPPPSSFRFHPSVRSKEAGRSLPALIVGALEGETVRRVQVIFLDPDTAGKAALKAPKLTFGAGAGHVPAVIHGGSRRIMCEGPEDAASIWSSTKCTVICSLGTANLDKPVLEPGELTIAGDNDQAGRRHTKKAAKAHERRECTVRIAFPPVTEDWNTILRTAGKQAIVDTLQAAKGLDATHGLPSYYPAPEEGRDAALKRQREAIAEWFAGEGVLARARAEVTRRREAWLLSECGTSDETLADVEPARKGAATRKIKSEVAAEFDVEWRSGRRVLVTGSQGTGKSRTAAECLARLPKGAIAWWVVPTIEKAQEQADEYHALSSPDSPPAMVVRGRAARNPAGMMDETRPDGTAMCPRHKVVNRAAGKNIPVRKVICENCPLLDRCSSIGYLSQYDTISAIEDAKGGVFLLAREHLFGPTPAPTADLVIIDERVTDLATPGAISFGASRIQSVAEGRPWATKGIGNALAVRETLRTISEALAAGKPVLASLRSAGVDQESISAALEFLRDDDDEEHREHPIHGSMDDAEIQRRLDQIEETERDKVQLLLRTLRRELAQPRSTANAVSFDPDAEIRVGDEVERMARVMVYPFRRTRIAEGVPILLLDGTGDPGLNRRLFGDDLEHIHVPVERQAHVTGTVGKAYSRQSITGVSARGAEISPRLTEEASRLRSEICAVAARQPGSVFAASNAPAMTALAGGLPNAAMTGHFGALRGLNAYEAAETAVIVGREQPPPAVVESIARGWAIDDPEPIIPVENYVLQTRGRRMRDGSIQPVEVQVHPDPRCQSLLEQIREAELVQAVDRCRPIFNHRRMVLMNNLAVDLTYDVCVEHRLLAAGGTRLERMAARGMILNNSGDMADAFPELWPSREAAKKDVARLGTFPKEVSIWNLSPTSALVPVSYQRSGPGRKPQTAWYDSKIVPDARAWLERRLGKLAAFTVEATYVVESRANTLAEPATLAENELNQPGSAELMRQSYRNRSVPADQVADWSARLDQASRRLTAAADLLLDTRKHRLANASAALEWQSPRPIMLMDDGVPRDPIAPSIFARWQSANDPLEPRPGEPFPAWEKRVFDELRASGTDPDEAAGMIANYDWQYRSRNRNEAAVIASLGADHEIWTYRRQTDFANPYFKDPWSF